MTEEQVTRIIEALQPLSNETDVPVSEIVDILTDFCWDEEDGSRIKRLSMGV